MRGDQEAINLLFNWSMVDYAETYLRDERLQMAVLGQGVIGTNASPHDPGTAFIHFHHSSGRLGGMTGMWGYVKGGMGMVSFILADVARAAGAVIAPGAPVARILPGEGVELAGGERLRPMPQAKLSQRPCRMNSDDGAVIVQRACNSRHIAGSSRVSQGNAGVAHEPVTLGPHDCTPPEPFQKLFICECEQLHDRGRCVFNGSAL